MARSDFPDREQRLEVRTEEQQIQREPHAVGVNRAATGDQQTFRRPVPVQQSQPQEPRDRIAGDKDFESVNGLPGESPEPPRGTSDVSADRHALLSNGHRNLSPAEADRLCNESFGVQPPVQVVCPEVPKGTLKA